VIDHRPTARAGSAVYPLVEGAMLGANAFTEGPATSICLAYGENPASAIVTVLREICAAHAPEDR
jgi:hypothetical protein